jgi:hypothetical protein
MRDHTPSELLLTVIFVGIYLSCYYVSLQRKKDWAIERNRPMQSQTIVGAPGKDASPSIGPPGPDGQMNQDNLTRNTSYAQQLWENQRKFQRQFFSVILYLVVMGAITVLIYSGRARKIVTLFIAVPFLAFLIWNWMNGTIGKIPFYMQAMSQEILLFLQAVKVLLYGEDHYLKNPKNLLPAMQVANVDRFRKEILDGYDPLLIINFVIRKKQLGIPEIRDPRQVIVPQYEAALNALLQRTDLKQLEHDPVQFQAIQESLRTQLQEIVRRYMDEEKKKFKAIYRQVSLEVHPDKVEKKTDKLKLKTTDIAPQTNPPMTYTQLSQKIFGVVSTSWVAVPSSKSDEEKLQQLDTLFYDYIVARLSLDTIPPLNPAVLHFLEL